MIRLKKYMVTPLWRFIYGTLWRFRSYYTRNILNNLCENLVTLSGVSSHIVDAAHKEIDTNTIQYRFKTLTLHYMLTMRNISVYKKCLALLLNALKLDAEHPVSICLIIN